MGTFNKVHNGNVGKVIKTIESSITICQFELGAKYYLSQFVREAREELLAAVKKKGLESFNCDVQEDEKGLAFIYKSI